MEKSPKKLLNLLQKIRKRMSTLCHNVQTEHVFFLLLELVRFSIIAIFIISRVDGFILIQFIVPTAATIGPDGKVSSGPGNYFPADPSIKGKFADPPKKLMKMVGQAVKEWDMIQDGDRLLLGLSGGKDSLALLHVLKALQVSSM